MAPIPGTPPRRPASSRARTTRPKSADAARSEKSTPLGAASEPPLKKRRYIPGGPGGGGRYVNDDGTEIPVGGTGPGGYNYVGSRGRIGRQNAALGLVPEVYNRRDRSTRTRTVLPRSQQPAMRFQSAAQAAAVVQSDGYKPREERAWEEFHPELDIDGNLRAFSLYEAEGIQESRPVTPLNAPQSAEGSVAGGQTPNGVEGGKAKSEGSTTPSALVNGEILTISIPGTPGGGKRRPGRPPKDPVAFFAAKAAKLGKSLNIGTPKEPKAIPPVSNFNAKEKLTLPQPSYRKTDTLARFEDRALGMVKYVDKSMANVGYQETDIFVRPERVLIKASDSNLEDDLDLGPLRPEGEGVLTLASGGFGRVEYDMDEQDDKWLETYNAERKSSGLDQITREVFEITITKIEKEWHALEKRIPKPNPKPPQTHRPRSSSAAAVNGEPQAGEEQDSKCAICDDGDCENTNAIVFCDGCDLAVHQECYGVPFIPEGQWLCRKCQLIGRGVPTCIFCPNTDGAFKQTNASKWAHLLCAMWIPEVSLGNTTFMEPVMEVEKVPKNRWKLVCYLCNQRMGACVQCGNKNCYLAFHVSCARRARLFLKMKNNHGTLAVLDGTAQMKAYCDKHCPPDYAKANDVALATRDARQFYKRTMKGRMWADSQASAMAMAASHRHAVTEHQPDESQLTGMKVALTFGDNKKKGNQPQKAVWKLPSGAPVIPLAVFQKVEHSIGRFPFQKRKEFAADACRYWTLKREARRGAALLKRLQLQMETFSSMELTRRNFAGMGPVGRSRLARRIEFAQKLIADLESVKEITDGVLKREAQKYEAVHAQEDFIDSTYFPIAKLLSPVINKILNLDSKNVFLEGVVGLQKKVEQRFYTTTTPFVQDLGDLFRYGINTEPKLKIDESAPIHPERMSPKKAALDLKERRRLAKRFVKAVQPQLEVAVRAEADITGKFADLQVKEMLKSLETNLQAGPDILSKEAETAVNGDGDVEMAESTDPAPDAQAAAPSEPADIEMQDADAPGEEIDEEEATTLATAADETTNTDSSLTALTEVNGNVVPATHATNGVKDNSTSTSTSPPTTNTYIPPPQTTPPTPPISNGDNPDPAQVLAEGGVLWYLKDMQPEGSSILPGSNVGEMGSFTDGEELSEMDDEELRGLGEGLEHAGVKVPVSPSKKKGKAKKKKKGRR